MLIDAENLSVRYTALPSKFAKAIVDLSSGRFGQVLRLWKGYREATVAFHVMPEWMEGQRPGGEEGGREEKRGPSGSEEVHKAREPKARCHLGLYLVIFAPKKGLLDVWRCCYGPHVMSLALGRDAEVVQGSCRRVDVTGDEPYLCSRPLCLPPQSTAQVPHVIVVTGKEPDRIAEEEMGGGGRGGEKETEGERQQHLVFSDLSLSDLAMQRLSSS